MKQFLVSLGAFLLVYGCVATAAMGVVSFMGLGVLTAPDGTTINATASGMISTAVILAIGLILTVPELFKKKEEEPPRIGLILHAVDLARSDDEPPTQEKEEDDGKTVSHIDHG